MIDLWSLLGRKGLLDSTEKSLKERQIEIAQVWVNLMAETRPEHKDKIVVDVEPTENWNEVVMILDDGTRCKVCGLVATKILAGKVL